MPFLVVLALMIGGIVIRAGAGSSSASSLVFLAWMLYLGWPRLTSSEKLMRSAILLLTAGVTLTRAFPRADPLLLTIILISVENDCHVTRVLPALVLGTLALTGCAAPHALRRQPGPRRRRLLPLAYAAQQVGGDRVTVETLTKPGGEPHDLELLPRQILDIQDAALVVHLALPARRRCGRRCSRGRAFPRRRRGRGPAHPDRGTRPRGGGPALLARPDASGAVGEAIADRLAQADPAGAAAYRANAAAFTAQLTTLDAEVGTGLATCTNRDLVTGHSAFGYFAERCGFTQEPISGPPRPGAPGQRPGPRRGVRARGDVQTIYAETIASPLITQALARETGAGSQSSTPSKASATSAAADYPGVMRANLATLRLGQDCPSTPSLPRAPSASATTIGSWSTVSTCPWASGGRRPARPQRLGKVDPRQGLFGLVPGWVGRSRSRKVGDASTDHARIGYVPQRHSLAQSVRSTVGEVVAAGPPAASPMVATGHPRRPRPRGPRDRGRRSERPRTRRGVDPPAANNAVLIARALAGRRCFVMDEPTAGVDHASQVVLTEVLGRLAASGTAMLVVTHELDVLADVVTRIVCLDAGHIDFDGSPGAYAAHLADADHPTSTPATTTTTTRPVADAALDFMRQALVAAVLVGIAAPMIGVFLVQRQMSLIGDGIGHVALPGSPPASSPGRCRWSPRSLRRSPLAPRSSSFACAGAPAVTSRWP